MLVVNADNISELLINIYLNKLKFEKGVLWRLKMSIYYLPRKNIKFSDLKSKIGLLKIHNIKKVDTKNSTVNSFSLFDGNNYVWCSKHGNTTLFAVYGANDGEFILNIIGKVFETEIVSEYEKEFTKLFNTLV